MAPGTLDVTSQGHLEESKEQQTHTPSAAGNQTRARSKGDEDPYASFSLYATRAAQSWAEVQPPACANASDSVSPKNTGTCTQPCPKTPHHAYDHFLAVSDNAALQLLPAVVHATYQGNSMTRPYAPKNQALFDQGLSTRREVLGSEYVDASIKNASDFNIDMQELVTQYCWGDVWNRPGLDRKTRSLLNLAMITALNRPHELKLHVRGAINNGLTKEEIKEVFLQTAIYCGVPAAIDSFRVASEVFKEMNI